jgi:DAK2 domain fusion protein YloV
VGQLRLTLQEYGGSLIVANIDDVIKIHVHSNHPGQVLEHCLQFGTLHSIQVSNMRDQWQQAHGNGATMNQDVASTAGKMAASREIGVLAVAAGEGIEQIFRSLGALEIVEGGQTMNPPVEEFVRAIEAMPNEQVLILPNNKNLIMAAEQAGKLVSRKVEILPTTNVQAGIAAILAFNPSVDINANIAKMDQAASRIKAAEVTYAAHDALFEDMVIKQGDLIGLWQGDIVAVGASLEQVLMATVDQMLDGHDELVTLLAGQEAPPEEADRIAALIRGNHPQIEVELQYGGQPVYFFLISVE